MIASWYRCVTKSRYPVETTSDIREWVARILDAARAKRPAEKSLMPAWAPHKLESDKPRWLRHVTAISALVLDYDHGIARGSDWLACVCAPWEGHPYLAHETWSSTYETPRVRIILPLAHPIPITEGLWQEIYRYILATIAPGADPQCLDPTRIHILPCAHPDGRPAAIRIGGQDNPLLDLRPLLDHIRAQRRAKELARRARLARLHANQYSSSSHETPEQRESRRTAQAQQAGATITNSGTIRRLKCPACNRRDAWGSVRGGPARCGHLYSCAWVGDLEDITGHLPPPHAPVAAL